jgi:hypothetical protein
MMPTKEDANEIIFLEAQLNFNASPTDTVKSIWLLMMGLANTIAN